MSDENQEHGDTAIMASAEVIAESIRDQDPEMTMLAMMKMTSLIDDMADNACDKLARKRESEGLPVDPRSLSEGVMGRFPEWQERLRIKLDLPARP